MHASTISDPTSPLFDLHWSIGPHPQDRRQALHQRTLAHQRSCGTPCGIREWVPAPVTDSEGGTVMPRAQDPYVNASRYLAAAITSFTPERHLLYPWVSRLCMNFARIPANTPWTGRAGVGPSPPPRHRAPDRSSVGVARTAASADGPHHAAHPSRAWVFVEGGQRAACHEWL